MSGGAEPASRAAERVREWGAAMEEALTELKDGLLHCEEYYSGPSGLGYHVDYRFGCENAVNEQFFVNDGEHHLDPSEGKVVPPNSHFNDGPTDVVIVSIRDEFVQWAAQNALQKLADVDECANALDRLTQEDVDDLCTLPEALAQSIEGLAEASENFNAGAEEIDRLAGELAGSAWQSDGRAAYEVTVDQQAEYFRLSRDDAEAIIEGNLEVVTLIEDLVETMMNIAQARRDSAIDLINEMKELITPPEWLDVATNLLERANDWKNDQQDELQQKLQELAQSAASLNVLDSIERTMVQQWPEAAPGLRPPPGPAPHRSHPGEPAPV